MKRNPVFTRCRWKPRVSFCSTLYVFPDMSQISDLGVAKTFVILNAGIRLPYGRISGGAFGCMTPRNASRRARYVRFQPKRLSDTHAPRVIVICAATRSCSFGYSRSFALLRTGRGSSVNGRSRVYVLARFAPLKTATSPLATTEFSVRFRVPRPRHRPTRGSATPDVERIG